MSIHIHQTARRHITEDSHHSVKFESHNSLWIRYQEWEWFCFCSNIITTELSLLETNEKYASSGKCTQCSKHLRPLTSCFILRIFQVHYSNVLRRRRRRRRRTWNQINIIYVERIQDKFVVSRIKAETFKTSSDLTWNWKKKDRRKKIVTISN
jgi:hypothetical protein